MKALRWCRGKPFLVAGILLLLVVAALFTLATMLPRLVVAPPRYDCLFVVLRPEPAEPAHVPLEIVVHEGRVEASARCPCHKKYVVRERLYRFDHGTRRVREVPVEAPSATAGSTRPSTFPVAALAGRRVLLARRAPDGYEFRSVPRGSGGLLSALFGMDQFGTNYVIIKDGRRIALDVPTTSRFVSIVRFLGWIVDEPDR